MLCPTISPLPCNCFLRSRFSPRSFLASMAFLTRMRVFSSESGFSRKSKAPSLVARTAVSMVPWPEMMMTSGASSMSRIRCSTSRPSMPGNHISSSTTSKGRFFVVSSALSPESADEVLYPSSCKTPCKDSRMLDSSSTMRMLCIELCGVCFALGALGFGGDRQLNYKARSHRRVFFNPHRTAMLLDDTSDDGKPQSSAAFLSGKVREKKFFLQLLAHSRPSIRHDDLDCVFGFEQRGRDVDLAH